MNPPEWSLLQDDFNQLKGCLFEKVDIKMELIKRVSGLEILLYMKDLFTHVASEPLLP